MTFGRPHEEPRHAELHHAKDEDPTGVANDGTELLASDDEGEEQECGRGGSTEDQEAGGEVSHCDADEQIGDAPEEGHRREKKPTLFCHPKSLLGR